MRSSKVLKNSSLIATAALISTLMIASPSHARPSCPGVKFFGVHGTNEDGPRTPGDEWFGVGESVWKAWLGFKGNNIPGGTSIEAVDFTKTKVDLPSLHWSTWAKFTYQVSQIEPGANKAAKSLANQIWATYQNCGTGTRYVIVGYSQGAWGIGKALRDDLKPVLPSVLPQIAGIYLMGDPAWPERQEWAGRRGIATAAGMGFKDDYVPKAVADRFRSMCVAYTDSYDPICMLKATPEKFPHSFPNIETHFEYRVNGMAEDGGKWLASIVR